MQSDETGSVDLVPVGHCAHTGGDDGVPPTEILLPLGQVGITVQVVASLVEL
jgi:hypothetical protein